MVEHLGQNILLTIRDSQNCGFMYSKPGIETVFARPYNARAKVIERFFKEFQEGFEKLFQVMS